MHFLELRHAQCEPPAAYSPVLESYGDVQTVLLGTDPLPAHRRFDAVIVMGGPMGVGDQGEVEWLGIRDRIHSRSGRERRPGVGECVWVRSCSPRRWVLASTRALCPKSGVEEITLTVEGRQDPVWGDLPSTFPAMQWHSDTFDIPNGAVRLAGSAKYPNQLFRYKQSYAVQFHLEASSEVAREWMELAEYRDSLHASLGADGPRIFMQQLSAAESQGLEIAAAVMGEMVEIHLHRISPFCPD